MAGSANTVSPRWGLGFLPLDSWIYRLEYLVGFLAIAWILIGWQWVIVKNLSAQAVGLSVFWFIWPDLAAFLPIGIAQRGKREWPSWGATLYNVLHNFLSWSMVFVSWYALAGSFPWPLLGWAAHLTMDRAAGFNLRAGVRTA
jgi:hypothetical protein